MKNYRVNPNTDRSSTAYEWNLVWHRKLENVGWRWEPGADTGENISFSKKIVHATLRPLGVPFCVLFRSTRVTAIYLTLQVISVVDTPLLIQV
jgi:hypothetical protein